MPSASAVHSQSGARSTRCRKGVSSVTSRSRRNSSATSRAFSACAASARAVSRRSRMATSVSTTTSTPASTTATITTGWSHFERSARHERRAPRRVPESATSSVGPGFGFAFCGPRMEDPRAPHAAQPHRVPARVRCGWRRRRRGPARSSPPPPARERDAHAARPGGGPARPDGARREAVFDGFARRDASRARAGRGTARRTRAAARDSPSAHALRCADQLERLGRAGACRRAPYCVRSVRRPTQPESGAAGAAECSPRPPARQSNSRARSRPPYGNAPWLAATIAVL